MKLIYQALCGLVVFLFPPAIAFGCGVIFPHSIEIDQSLVGVDTEPPTKISSIFPMVERAHNRAPGGCLGSTSCDDIAYLKLLIGSVSDDTTARGELGVILEVSGGQLPSGLGIPQGEPLGVGQYHGNLLLVLPWSESLSNADKPFDFTLDVFPVDRAGNVGQPTTIRVRHRGDELACSSALGKPMADAGWLLLLAGLLCLRTLARNERSAA